MLKRKLIEVSLPLEEINAQSAREKSIRHGHPSTLHLWWARRPLATARAVLFAQLVDDPSNFVEEYRQEAVDKGYEDADGWAEHRVKQERQRLFDLITRMVNWDNLGDEALFDEIRAEILRSTDGNPPAILDPFAGGGTIPLEAQRLGLEANASDINPVAVLINKALVEIPPKFAGRNPVFPGAAGQRNYWPRATGLAEDVRRYGRWMRDEAEKAIGHLYPKATLPGGEEASVIAWIWARTVTCPNPACGIEMPLVRSWWLGKKKGKESYVVPKVIGGRVEYGIGHEPKSAPYGSADGTVARTAATCISCGGSAPLSYVRAEGRASRLGMRIIAVVAEGDRQRHYLAPSALDEGLAEVGRPDSAPSGSLPPHGLSPANPQTVRIYGFDEWADLFTNRQLLALTTLSSLVAAARERVLVDALAEGEDEGARLEDGGLAAAAYADSVATYLALGISRTSDRLSGMSGWDSSRESVRNTFGRQAIPMSWDFAEVNLFSESSGNFIGQLEWTAEVVDRVPAAPLATARQADAASRSYSNVLVSTDPPYYDNIGYSDLSDYFYVWLRRSAREIHPGLLGTILVPKAEELVANPHRHGGKDGAKNFFESGFENVFKLARNGATDRFPITVYYAFKQSESDEGGEASTGWETILGSMVHSGWRVTATWPVRSELSNRMIASGSNALASSVVLALRPRDDRAAVTDRRGFIAAMRRELGPALRELQQGGIAPVDLPQSAIGPGMAVFSRYSRVIESDGSEMTVRSALARINEVLDELLTEQEGDFDPPTRFALAWYRGHGYQSAPFGEAEDLARARGTAVSAMERSGVLSARGGKVQVYRPSELPSDYDVLADASTSTWEALHHAIRILETQGVPSVGGFLQVATQRSDGTVDLDLVKELAYLLFQVAEKNGWTKDALSFNAIASSWGDILDATRIAVPTAQPGLGMFDFDSLSD